MQLELSFLDSIQSYLRCDFLDAAMPIISMLGNAGAIWIACAVVLLLIPKTRRVGVVLAVSLALEAICCNFILKPLVARIRPFDMNTAAQLLISAPKDFSFPSGHTGAAFAAASALFFSKNRLWIPSLILAILIAFSRLYLYVHYPTDVLGGALLGILSGWLGHTLVGLIKKKRI